MKFKSGKISRSTLSLLLVVCLLVSCLTVGLIPTEAAKVEGNSVGAGPYTIYMIPKSDMANEGSTYRLNYKNTNNSWGTTNFSFTGRTYQGRPIYSTTFSPATDKSYNVQLQVGTGTSFNWDLYAGEHSWSDWDGKYFDANDSGSWNSSVSFDTYCVFNGTSNLGNMTWSSNKYTLTQSLTAGQTYKLRVYNSSYGYGSKYFQCVAKTQSATGSTTMYAYDNASDTAVISITPVVTANYTFEWTLTDSQNDNSKVHVKNGDLNVIFPTIYTVSYNFGDSNVSKDSTSGGTDNGSGTISAVSGSNVVINVTYASGYEYDESQSSIDNATVSNSGTTFTYSNISANKSLTIRAKQSKFNVEVAAGTGGSVSAQAGSAGSVSGTTITGLTPGQGGTITATPDTQNNYVFSSWTASPAENISFDNAGAATTTFTATAAATITANFTQETLYPVTVKLDGLTETTVNAGTTISRTITCADRSDSDYEFRGWTLEGNVSLADGYNLSDPMIEIKASGTGGRVTANYEHVDYIYFYGALQSNWGKNPVVTVDGSEVAPYAWIAQKDNNDLPAKTLYSGTTEGSAIGSNDCKTYYIAVYRVPVSMKGKNISVFGSVQDGDNPYINGTLSNDQGRCYYTYSEGEGQNHSGTIPPQKVNSVTIIPSQNFYDLDSEITVEKGETMYYGSTTAGHDGFTYTFKLVNQTTNAEITLAANEPSSTASYQFKPEDKSTIVPGSYKAVVVTKDNKTGRIINSCASAAFTIQSIPTSSTVTYSAANSTVSTHNYTYYTSTPASFDSGASLRAGSAVTLVYSLNDGYTYSASANPISASGVTPAVNYDNSNNRLTVTFTVPSGGTPISISYTATEIKHTVTLKKRFFTFNGSSQIGSAADYTTISAGISTAASTGDAPTEVNYTFHCFTLPSGGVTKAGGDLNTQSAISVNATEDNKTIYLDYWETVHDITVSNDGHGTVQRNSTNVTTTEIGNVTAVSLTAVNARGYDFKEWVITKSGTATKVTVGSTEYTLGSTPTTIAAATAGATSAFKFNGTATLTANFKPVNYSISAAFPSGNTYTTSSETGNDVTVSKGSGNIGDTFDIVVMLAPGYEVDTITGTGITSTKPTPTVSGNKERYTYTLSDSSVEAVVTLKAKEPSLTNVQIKDTTFEYITPADGATVNHYYKQPNMVKGQTDDFATLTYTNDHDTKTGNEVSVSSDPSLIPKTEDGTVTYTLTVTATNAKPGVTTLTIKKTYTISVSFNNTQKVYYRLCEWLNEKYAEDETGNPYYKPNAPISAYNTAFTAATNYKNAGYPAYDAGDTALTEANKKLSDFQTAYENLMTYAKTTKVYVLSKYANDTNHPLLLHVWGGNGLTDADEKHFKMYSYGSYSYAGASFVDDDTYKMSFEGTFQKDGNRYLYSFEYAGHINFIVFRGDSAADGDLADPEKLTGDVTGLMDFKEYYINLDNTDTGSTATKTAVDYYDFDHEVLSGKKYVELNETKTKDQIISLFGFTPSGSLCEAPGITVTNTALTITGPVGKGTSKIYDLINNRVSEDGGLTWDTLSEGKFPADQQGRYTVSYTSRFGYDAAGNEILRPKTASLWVAFDDVKIYVDMNDNVGIPILNFKYYVDNNGDPAASGTEAYLPYEMDLVTGSESIYKYTIKVSKLREDYKIAFETGTPIKISYINVERMFVYNDGKQATKRTGANLDNYAFSINPEARITGEVWFKANSTNMTTFIPISYGSVTTDFVAVDEVGSGGKYTVISPAVKSIKGTGILTDEDEVYKAQYAAKYTLDGASAPVYNFNYVLNTGINEEVKVGNVTYYFDKWVRFKTSEDGNPVDANSKISIPSKTESFDGSTQPHLNFTSAMNYSDGESSYTYVALYKQASSDTTARIEVTYKFQDYNTSDGNFVYDEHKKTVDASYTKTIKLSGTVDDLASDKKSVTVPEGQPAVYTSAAIDAIVGANAPYVKSNYFDYSYEVGSVRFLESGGVNTDENKVTVTATLTHTAREYTIILKNGATSTTYKGKYQNTVELSADSVSDPAWKDSNDKVLAIGPTYKARFVSSGNEKDEGTDCQVIKLISDSQAAVANTSVVSNSFTEVYYTDNGTEMLRHNFYIIDYCAEGELKGGGVLFATTDGTKYRQTGVTDYLGAYDAPTIANSITARKNFITSVLGGDFDTEYKAQTIKNVGFRYKPFNPNEDVYRYSDDLHAYLTMYEGTNVNSVNYGGQKLRLFSFMVYDNNGTNTIVVSDGFAEVDRYIE